jgi:GxxExxY protein
MFQDELSWRVIGAAIEVHRRTGPGLLESAYEHCLAFEMARRGIAFRRQVGLPIRYGEVDLDAGYRLDFLVDDHLIVELKATESVEPIHEAQLLTYLRLSGKPIGLLLNFNVRSMKQGIRRLLNT